MDKITGHEPNSFTWMTRALSWIPTLGLKVIHVENLDYLKFANFGKSYLKTIWDKETYELQEKMSDLDKEQMDAREILKNRDVHLINNTLDINDIKTLHKMGFFIMLSINPNILLGDKTYGSHLVVVTQFKDGMVTLCDPDHGIVSYPEKLLSKAISKKFKPDFSATIVYK